MNEKISLQILGTWSLDPQIKKLTFLSLYFSTLDEMNKFFEN